ncbi:type II secretion system protein [Planctomycetota bacterium]
MQREKAFTLIELLVAISVIAALMAISIPVLNRARQAGLETACKSNLRQMLIMLQNFAADNDGRFPSPDKLYHSSESFMAELWPAYYNCCRWHDQRTAQGGTLLKEHPELQGALSPYIGNPNVLICKVGKRANELRGCWNACPVLSKGQGCEHDNSIPIETQYTYTMNNNLNASFTTGTGVGDGTIDMRSLRSWRVKRLTQVTRSPSEVFAFGEQNSWAINKQGKQPNVKEPHWPAGYSLSGKFIKRPLYGYQGTLRLSALQVNETFYIEAGNTSAKLKSHAMRYTYSFIGDCFATYHRPPGQDLNAGHSYMVMLDGHVEKVTVADQLRASRRIDSIDPGRYLPGGNVSLAWPLDVPPPGEWAGQ